MQRILHLYPEILLPLTDDIRELFHKRFYSRNLLSLWFTRSISLDVIAESWQADVRKRGYGNGPVGDYILQPEHKIIIESTFNALCIRLFGSAQEFRLQFRPQVIFNKLVFNNLIF